MRVQGTEGVKLLECINPYRDRWRVRWDIQPNNRVDEQGNTRTGINYEEAEYLHKPSIQEIKDTILGWYNKLIDNKILTGLVWKDFPIWLSSENQFNYKSAYDIAVQTKGLNLPIPFKFGIDTTVYYTFNSLDELSDFYLSCVVFVQDTLREGWESKDRFDWSIYENLLNNGDN